MIKRIDCEKEPIGCGIIFETKHLIEIGLYNEKFFLNESVDFLPTLVLYNNGEIIYKAEAGIDLKLPEDYKINFYEKIEELIENKF